MYSEDVLGLFVKAVAFGRLCLVLTSSVSSLPWQASCDAQVEPYRKCYGVGFPVKTRNLSAGCPPQLREQYLAQLLGPWGLKSDPKDRKESGQCILGFRVYSWTVYGV